MKTSFFLLILLFSTSAISTVIKTEKKGFYKIVHYDYNEDKKVDLIETFEKDVLIKKVQDMNYDGVMDETTEYFYDTKADMPFKISTKKDRRTKYYRNKKLKKIISTTEIDLDGDGKYDKKITDNYPLVQESDPCFDEQKQSWSAVEGLSKTVSRVTDQVNNGYIQNEMGYKIHQSCLKNYGVKNFSEIVTKTMKKGLICLKDLAKKNTNDNPTAPNGALNNFMNLTRLLEKNEVTIVCHQSDYSWKGVAAHASSNSNDKIDSLKVTHPYISVSPSSPAVKGDPSEEEITDLEQTLFHEQLHNLGILHGEGVEYPYSCEKCCLGQKNDHEGVFEAACKVCAGQYDMSKGFSKEYLIDSLQWGEKSFDTSQAQRAIVKYQKENKKNQWASILYARSNASLYSAVGIEMAKILVKKFPNLTSVDKINIEAALIYKDSPHIQSVSANAKIIAEAFLIYYYDNDASSSLKILEKNQAIIKSIIAESNKSGVEKEQSYVNKKLLDDTKMILVEIWFENYPDNKSPENYKAYSLLIETGLLE